jgi:glycosyltransferase involved in cell wall biosynthesis
VISVITCIFNQQKHLFDACALSVQKLGTQFEWIIVDDGSTAAAKASYCESLRRLETEGQVKFIELGRNTGLAHARNVGLSEAAGDWIVILDSDDELTAHTAPALNELSETSLLVCFQSEVIKVNGTAELRTMETWASCFEQFGGTVADPMLWFDFYYHGMIARRRIFELIGGYDPKLRVGEDQDILLRACEMIAVSNVSFLHEVGYRYRQNPNGVCATEWQAVEANYRKTMLAATHRRGGGFHDCRFIGPRRIEGADVDEYQYLLNGHWMGWEEMGENVSGHKVRL